MKSSMLGSLSESCLSAMFPKRSKDLLNFFPERQEDSPKQSRDVNVCDVCTLSLMKVRYTPDVCLRQQTLKVSEWEREAPEDGRVPQLYKCSAKLWRMLKIAFHLIQHLRPLRKNVRLEMGATFHLCVVYIFTQEYSWVWPFTNMYCVPLRTAFWTADITVVQFTITKWIMRFCLTPLPLKTAPKNVSAQGVWKIILLSF